MRGRLQMVCPVLPSLQIISERHPLDLAPPRESKEPFVIPTLNIFLKIRFRPDSADTGPAASAHANGDEAARGGAPCPLLSLRNEGLGLGNYGRADINKVLQRSRCDSSRLIAIASVSVIN